MIHKNLATRAWENLSFVEQMANIGSEVSRTIAWKDKNAKDANLSFNRTLELIGLTMKDPKNRGRLREIARVKELFTDWFLGEGSYKSSKEVWQKYFLQFAIASRLGK